MGQASIGFPITKTVEMAGAKDPSGKAQPLLVDGSGNLLVSGSITASNPSVGVNGATAPTSSTEIGGIGADGNLHGISVDNTGHLNVNVISSVLPTGAATDASIVALQVSQGSTTSGQRGDLVMGAVTTAAPTYVTAQTAPLSLTTAGRLRVDSTGSSTSSPVNTNGSYAEITNLTTTAQTFTVPANAVGFVMETDSSAGINIRWKIGATATTTSGMIMEPGRDTGFIPCAANVSVIAVSGSGQFVSIQWVLSS